MKFLIIAAIFFHLPIWSKSQNVIDTIVYDNGQKVVVKRNAVTTTTPTTSRLNDSIAAVKLLIDAKQNSLGFTPVPNTLTVNGHALSGNVSVTTTDLSLQNVTNESKATMFTSPTFTGNAVLGTPASGNFSTGTFTWPTFNQNTSGTAANVTTNANLTGDVTSVGNATTIKSSVSLTTPNINVATATSLAASGALTSSSASAGIGYSTGSGLSVVQATNKTTGVTINSVTGTITTVNSAMAAAAEIKFTVSDSRVAATDLIILNIKSGGTSGAYLITVGAVTAGSFDVVLSNASAGSLSEAVVISFAVIKGVAN